MPVMFLLNPPKKGGNGHKLLPIKYPPRMGASAKPRPRPSRTVGGRRVSSALRETLGLKAGERPIRHRITFYRHPTKKTGRKLIRTPFAAFRNPKKKRKGVKSIMARRRRVRRVRHNARRRHLRRRRVVVVANPVRRRRHHRRARRNVAFNARRRHSRRRVRAIVLANPRRIRRHRRYHRNPVALANPFKPRTLLGPITQAAGMFGGYFVTNYLTEMAYPQTLGRFVPATYEKWAKPGAKIIVSVGLSYVAKKFIFKRSPTIGNYILLGGLFSAVKDLIGNLVGTIGITAPGSDIDKALRGYTDEPLSDYIPEPADVALGDVSEGQPERYQPLYA